MIAPKGMNNARHGGTVLRVNRVNKLDERNFYRNCSINGQCLKILRSALLLFVKLVIGLPLSLSRNTRSGDALLSRPRVIYRPAFSVIH